MLTLIYNNKYKKFKFSYNNGYLSWFWSNNLSDFINLVIPIPPLDLSKKSNELEELEKNHEKVKKNYEDVSQELKNRDKT